MLADADYISDLLQQYGIRVCFVGRTELFPDDVKAAIRHMEETTAKNNAWVGRALASWG